VGGDTPGDVQLAHDQVTGLGVLQYIRWDQGIRVFVGVEDQPAEPFQVREMLLDILVAFVVGVIALEEERPGGNSSHG
jgi:hypothetical protein